MAQMIRSNSADVMEVYNVRKTLEFAKPKLVFPQFGQPDMVMKRKGQTASWLKFSKLAIPSAVLSDSPTWSPETVTDSTVTATLELWGNGVELVEALEQTSFLDLPDEYKKLIGQNAGETINEKVRDILIAGTSVNYANAKANRGAILSTDTADLDDFLDVVESLEAADAPKIGDEYVAIISPYVKTRLMKDTAFREAVRYLAKGSSMFTGELVSVDGTKFVVTSTAPNLTNSGSASGVSKVEQSIILGDGAYGIARLMPGDFDVVVTPPGGHGDEYKVKTSIAWKVYLKAVILQQAYMRRLETAR
ncbi:N4-gp56 family major capsid protein [Candidatus Dojkabacteria bacterium]|jgi:N4-gp56 family major capsid protein|nr:N4-gp56 family major capsid protein [Candidatus Dojkabacteria bacterium]